MWAISVPILVFLGLSVRELRPMYATDRSLNAPTIRGGGIISSVNITVLWFARNGKRTIMTLGILAILGMGRFGYGLSAGQLITIILEGKGRCIDTKKNFLRIHHKPVQPVTNVQVTPIC